MTNYERITRKLDRGEITLDEYHALWVAEMEENERLHPGTDKPKRKRLSATLLIAIFDCEDSGTFCSVLFLPFRKNDLELRVWFEDLKGRTVR